MSDGIWVALSGAIAQSTVLESTATDLANATTDGYQRRRVAFREVLAGQGMHYAAAGGATLDGTAGSRRATGRALDVALPAGVFLAVATPRGERYTRAGALTVATDGTVRAPSGDAVLGEDGAALRAPPGADPGEVTLEADGALRRGETALGRLRLVSFAQPGALAPEGSTLLATSPASGVASPVAASLDVGALEASNASVITAMTDLVSATRTFEAFQRVIDAFREADRRVTSSVPDASR